MMASRSGQPIDRTDPYAGKRQPPDGLVARLSFYGRQNGYLYAVLGYAGRKSFALWCLIAPLFTASRITKWLAEPGPRIVNLGGGGNTFDRWLTADMDPRADVFVDVTKRLPFPAESIDVFYLEEVIEHVSLDQARRLVEECFRALKPGGALRLTTPCMDLLAARFDGTTDYEAKMNDMFYNHGHRHIFAKAGIASLLTDAGFTALRESSFRDEASDYGHFDTHAIRISLSDETITQYWDAEKRG